MRPNGGKKGSRGAKGKKEARPNGKRGKPTRGGKNGRGGNKAGGRMGRQLSFENGKKPNKLSGMRKGDLSGKDLRFVPVLFVKAVDDFELSLETKPNDEDSQELEPIQGPTGLPLHAEISSEAESENSEKLAEESEDEIKEIAEPSSVRSSAGISDPDVDATGNSLADDSLIESSNAAIDLSSPASVEASVDAPADASMDDGLESSSAVTEETSNPQIQNKLDTNKFGDMSGSDFEELDAKLEAQFDGTEDAENTNASHLETRVKTTNGAHNAPDVPAGFDESVSRLAIDTSSDSDNQSPFEYDLYNASQVDESIFESLSDPEPDYNEINYEDYDLSDMRAGMHSQNEDNDDDDEDNMDELDDDQIFALANMATRKVNEYDDLDDAGFDKYDEFDEYFDHLLDRSTEVPPSTKQRASEGRKLKREARQLLHSMNFGKAPVLWQKYPEEIGVREVLDEIRHFAAQREFQSLSFPPLDNNANWYVKQFAKEHGLRPSVEGHDSQKHVICHLTGRATSHSGKGINKLLNRRKFFRRVDTKPVGGKQKARTPGAKVRDGHVVGQHASEITNDNFGHRLMRQMGWSEGSGLGKERAGIVAPIPATVKLTKTGLGA